MRADVCPCSSTPNPITPKLVAAHNGSKIIEFCACHNWISPHTRDGCGTSAHRTDASARSWHVFLCVRVRVRVLLQICVIIKCRGAVHSATSPWRNAIAAWYADFYYIIRIPLADTRSDTYACFANWSESVLGASLCERLINAPVSACQVHSAWTWRRVWAHMQPEYKHIF